MTPTDCLQWFTLGAGTALTLWGLGFAFQVARRVANLSVIPD